MFKIIYSDGERIWSRTGHWEDLPSDQVQVVDYMQMDGGRVRLAGFDSYYLSGLLWGGMNDSGPHGWRYELMPGRPARLLGPVGGMPDGALVKRGSLIPDALAARLGLRAGAAA